VIPARPSRYDPGVITDRQPVGWGRAVFLSMTLFVLLFVLEGLVAGQLTNQQTTLAAGLLAAIALMFGVAMILPVCFELAFANRRREWAAFGAARARRWISGIAIFIPAAIGIGAVAIAITSALHLTGTNDLGADHSGLGYKIALSALAVMVAPWTEEVAMRGFLFSALARRFGFWPGALVSGVVWAGLHVEPGVLILFSAEGMLLAWLRRRTGSLLPGIGLHGSWNTLVMGTTGGGWVPVPFLGLLFATIYSAVRWMPDTPVFVPRATAAATAAAPLVPDTVLTRRYPAPALMGVINVTPDSFSDGGDFLDPEAAIAHGLALAEAGADLIDIGGESTRPGAEPVSEQRELARVIPVIEGLAARTAVPISIDTMKAEVARRAIAAGAAFVNDVSALRHDPAMAEVVRAAGVPVCLMHMQGTPGTMQDDPRYVDVVAEVGEFLAERARFAESQGIARELICIDPGIGFGKTIEHNLTLLRELDRIAALGYPVLVALSRKRFLGQITGRAEKERVAGTVAANLEAYRRGGWMFRVHDVAPNREALDVAAAVGRGRP
jgi:dihydropteroate synthase